MLWQGEIIDPNTGLPPVEGAEGAQPGAMGFAAGLMMKELQPCQI